MPLKALFLVYSVLDFIDVITGINKQKELQYEHHFNPNVDI